MAKPLKIVLWIVGGFVLLVAGAAIALPLLFDPNDYKPQIVKAVKDATGRDLVLAGDIKLRIFPWLGAGVKDVTLGNAPGFGPEPFAKVGEVDAGVRLLPLLFDREVRVGTVTLSGLQVNLAKSKDGLSNWDDLMQPSEQPPEPAPPAQKPAVPAFDVGAIEIADSGVSYVDRQSGADYRLSQLALSTGSVSLGKPVKLTLSFQAALPEQDLTADVNLDASVMVHLEQNVYEIDGLKVKVAAKGAAVPAGKQDVSLRGALRFDGNTGAMKFSDGVLEALGLTVQAAIDGQNLTTDKPALTGTLTVPSFRPRDVAKNAGAELPPMADKSALSTASLSARYSGDFNSARLDNISLKLDQTTATGHLYVSDFATQALNFALKLDRLDADRYLPPPSPDDAKKTDAQKKEELDKTPIPAELLDQINGKGVIELGEMILKGVKLTNVKLTLDAPRGKVKNQNLSAQLYGGKIAQSAQVTPGATPKYDVKLGLDSVNAGPLTQDFLGKNYLSGLGNLNLGVTTSGKTVGDVLKALNGNLASSFVNGAVEGFNLEQTLGTARALYKKEPLPAADAPKRTAFSDLNADGRIENGVLRTRTLNAKGSWYNLSGDGDVNLAGQTINYVLKPTISGDKYKDLQGTAIPVKVSGNLFSPSVKVDLESVLKARAKEEVKEELKKQEDKLKEKYGDRLGDIFKKK